MRKEQQEKGEFVKYDRRCLALESIRDKAKDGKWRKICNPLKNA